MTANSKKLSEYSVRTAVSGSDRVYIVYNMATVPEGAAITVDQFLRNLNANVDMKKTALVRGNFTAQGSNSTFKSNTNFYARTIVNRLEIANSFIKINSTATPANGSTNMGYGVGAIWADNNYLYRQVSNSVIKRIAFSTF